jgi:hypothetical protein
LRQIGPGRIQIGAGVPKSSRLDVPVPRCDLDVFFSIMLRLVQGSPMTDGDQDDIAFEWTAQPSMTADLAAALAQLVRAALGRRAERTERAA